MARQLREGGNADNAKPPLSMPGDNCPQPSSGPCSERATPSFGTCTEATPTDFGSCSSSDVPPCNDTEAAICHSVLPVTLRQTLKLANDAKNRPSPAPSSNNEATPTLPLRHHTPSSNEPPPISDKKNLKNRLGGQSSGGNVEERERREEDTGQLDQSNQSDQLDDEGEGPISHER